MDLSSVDVVILYYITGIPFSEQQALKIEVKIISIIKTNFNVYSVETQTVGTHMDFIIQKSLKLVESGLVPDQAIRAAIRALSKKRLIQEGRYDPEQGAQRYMDVLNMLKHSEIAIETDKANEQHYELPTAFFQAVLGKRLKYSACFFP